MDFSFSKQQKMLKKSVNQFLSKECVDLAKESENAEHGFSMDAWRKIAELGWLGIGIPETYGGIEGDMLDLVIVLEEMGYFLFPGPFIDTLAICAHMIATYGTSAQKDKYLPGITDGNLIIMPAIHRPLHYATEMMTGDKLITDGDDRYLSGTRLFIPFGRSADFYLYLHQGDNSENAFFLIDANKEGITKTVLETIAADKQVEISLTNVVVQQKDIFGKREETDQIAQEIHLMGALCESAYILGMLKHILDMTVAYSKKREQFGHPIGSFQIIQHQCADMLIMIEQLQNLTYHAAWKLSEGFTAEKDVSMAKAKASDAARFVSLMGVKIHGGIGIIDEYDMQHYFRRAKARELSYGDAQIHRDMVAEALGL